MPTTPKLGLPYPALSDLPSGPLALQNLATAVDAYGVIGGKRLVTPGAAILSIETIVIDTQTLSLPAAGVFKIDFYFCFLASVAGSDADIKIRQTSVSGTIIAETVAFGTYVTPQPNHGHLTAYYKTTVAELDYFCASAVRVGAGTGTISSIVPCSLIVSYPGSSSLVGDY